MDIWFTLFVLVVALAASIGFVLLLVGYIEVIPASVVHGWRWVLPTLLLPVAGPLWFCARHWPDCSKTGKRIAFGAILLILAVVLLYGAGPSFVARMAAGMK